MSLVPTVAFSERINERQHLAVPIRTGLCFQSIFWNQGRSEGWSCSGSHPQLEWMGFSWLPWQCCAGMVVLAHICRAFLPICGGWPKLQRGYWVRSSLAFFTISSLSHPWEVKWAGKIKWQKETSFMTRIKLNLYLLLAIDTACFN